MAKKLTGVIDKLEQVFEERVARALGSIGVPTREDIDALTRQVDQLRETVASLTQPARQPASKKAAPRKRAVKTSAS
jgi:poly(hydroxyalkanoate) granule-associated protein